MTGPMPSEAGFRSEELTEARRAGRMLASAVEELHRRCPCPSDVSSSAFIVSVRSVIPDQWGTQLTNGVAFLLDWLEDNRGYRWARLSLHRHEHAVPPTLFLGGVGWDALTLKRIDALFDNLILGIYLLLFGAFIVLSTLARNDASLPRPLVKLNTWSPSIIQFLAGGLFSAYVIYYTRSASFSEASLFLLVLVALLVANEVIWERVWSSYLLLGIYFLAVFCYLTFFLPTVFGTMGIEVFLGSGLLSAGVVVAIILYLHRRNVFGGPWQFRGAVGLVGGLFGLMVLFYVNHWIPPVPLALQEGGIYHEVERVDDAYVLRYQSPPWYRPWQTDDDPFHYTDDETVYCFTSVFAPTALRTDIYHHWQVYNPDRETWVDTDRIGYQLVGGRRGGFRGFTFKENVTPGMWRVTVETADGRPIGRVRFEVVAGASEAEPSYTERRYE